MKIVKYLPKPPALLGTPADENSPLLSKCPENNYKSIAPRDQQDAEEEISTSILAWIMTTVWIGTFCAGLGGYMISLLDTFKT
jgi:hypothetical protein